MVTKSQVVSLARARWGKRAYVEENRRAPTAAERTDAQAKRSALMARVREIDEWLKVNANPHEQLSTAARFVVDVDGDDPSIEQLRVALEADEAWRAMTAERREARADADRQRSHGHRWQAGENLGWALQVEAQGDSLDELAAALSSKPAATP